MDSKITSPCVTKHWKEMQKSFNANNIYQEELITKQSSCYAPTRSEVKNNVTMCCQALERDAKKFQCHQPIR